MKCSYLLCFVVLLFFVIFRCSQMFKMQKGRYFGQANLYEGQEFEFCGLNYLALWTNYDFSAGNSFWDAPPYTSFQRARAGF